MSRARWRLSSQGWGLIFVAPVVIFFALVNVFPLFQTLTVSFFDYNFLTGERELVWFDNYVRLFADDAFLGALANTFLYVLLIVPASLLLSLGVALLLNAGIRAAGLFRTVYFIPVITSIVASGYIWSWLYDPTFGPINQVMAPLGIQLPFLHSTTMALPSIALMSVWKNLGFNVVIFLAGLQGIPDTVYEAARIDGTPRWRILWRITVPLLGPTIVFLSVMGVMRALKIFGEILVMTEDGGPLGSTASIVSHLVEVSFHEHRMGYGAAMTVVLFLIILTITLLQMKFLQRDVEY